MLFIEAYRSHGSIDMAKVSLLILSRLCTIDIFKLGGRFNSKHNADNGDRILQVE